MLTWIRELEWPFYKLEIADFSWGVMLSLDQERYDDLMNCFGTTRLIDVFYYETVIYWGY